ncbi:MAG: hypothetical protein M3349_04575, partial [Actinomycetota bacterium]|nr:hypothetical protein [Actinomycetota bacterium]
MSPPDSSSSPRSMFRLLFAVARHPDVWLQAARVTWRTAPAGWWRRPPFLPISDETYRRWRITTAYGGKGETTVDPDDVVAYLR